MNVRIAVAGILGLASLGASYSGLSAQEPEPRTVWDGVYTAAQAARGEQLYGQHCSACHGRDLEGDGEALPLAGQDFFSIWNGEKLGPLFDRIHLDMPLNRPGTLSSEADADILAFILRFNDFPDGKSELSHNPAMLNMIRFEMTKPEKKK